MPFLCTMLSSRLITAERLSEARLFELNDSEILREYIEGLVSGLPMLRKEAILRYTHEGRPDKKKQVIF